MSPDSRWQSAAPLSYWLDDDASPAPRADFPRRSHVDLVVIGGGLTGLWAAVRSLERHPERSVLLLEATRIAEHASGRNGGFCSASITHGDANGRARWPEEMPTLRRLGMENLDAIEATIERYGIECGARRTGELDVAVEPWQVEELRAEYEARSAAGLPDRYLVGSDLTAEFGSPRALAGLLDEQGTIMLDPARLCWGLMDAIESLGGTICEFTTVDKISTKAGAIEVHTNRGPMFAQQVVVATSAFRPLVRSARRRIVPIYDYVLVTEPLTETQIEEIGWTSRRGVSDEGNLFHYLRLTDENRILFGGYEPAYRMAHNVDSRYEDDDWTFDMLAKHFDETFPSLAGIPFSHRWAGAIDTNSRFCAACELSHDNKVVTVNGFTGLGVGSSRFFADAGLDLLDGLDTEATRTEMMRRLPTPFPPQPIKAIGVLLTQRAIARADRHEGKRGLWLRLLDRLGLGFDS